MQMKELCITTLAIRFCTHFSFERREQELQAQQLVLEAFAARLAGEKDLSLNESKKLIANLIEGK